MMALDATGWIVIGAAMGVVMGLMLTRFRK